MARCAPVLHVVNWQNAVKAVSGEDILDEVTLDLMLTSDGCSISSEGDVDCGGAGKQVSWLMGAFGW